MSLTYPSEESMQLPQTPPKLDILRDELSHGRSLRNLARAFEVAFKPTQNGQYRHWDKLRYLEPPEGLSHEHWWFAIKMARSNMAHNLPLTDAERLHFTYAVPDAALEGTHKIDQLASGQISSSEVVTNTSTRNRYLVNSLIEEAITSSQLEGASTSRKVAKDMIRSGRQPRTKSERMILNNYVAMRRIHSLQHEELSPDLICELHRMVTDGTLDDPKDAGRLQTPQDTRVEVLWTRDKHALKLHTPPPAEQLPQRMEAMCKFANGEEPEGFLHPVIRAIVLHFWLAYDHPFADGNGRTARALFYWSMLRQNYWLVEYLTISNILAKAPARYARSFLYVETDERDLTYFILFHLKVILRAIAELNEYLQRKMDEVKEIEALVRNSARFNGRQIALIGHALRHPDASYTARSHGSSHNINQETGRLDLIDLENRGLLVREKIGKENHFFPPGDLPSKLRTV